MLWGHFCCQVHHYLNLFQTIKCLFFSVKQQLCALVPGWVSATVRAVLLVDCSDTARKPNVGKQCSMHLHPHVTVHPCLRPVCLRLTLNFSYEILPSLKSILLSKKKLGKILLRIIQL